MGVVFLRNLSKARWLSLIKLLFAGLFDAVNFIVYFFHGVHEAIAWFAVFAFLGSNCLVAVQDIDHSLKIFPCLPTLYTFLRMITLLLLFLGLSISDDG